MHIDIFTLFPEIFPPYLNESILKRAQAAGLLSVGIHNIREYAQDKHRTTDDTPYGGGGGMILKPEPLFRAVETVLAKQAMGEESQPRIVLLTPQGRPFTQAVANELSSEPHLLLLCGRYEGFDERIREHLATDEVSLGDFVLTGGELVALAIVDAVTRLLPGALGAAGAAEGDSHASGLLEGPHYTRPEEFRGWRVPDVLTSGHGANIARWRREQGLRRTWQRRPELLLTAVLSEEDRRFLAELAEETVEKNNAY